MKLPHIDVRPVGEFAKGNIRQPNYQALGEAAGDVVGAGGNLAVALHNRKIDSEYTAAMGEAAQELSVLRAKLESSNSLPVEEIPDDIAYESSLTILDPDGESREIDRPTVFTHEVADEWWNKKSQEIVDRYASNISSDKARSKFVGEMGTRYIAPGSMAIAKASIIRARAHNQAVAQNTIQEILASNAPTSVREEQAREVIARQLLLGADPLQMSIQLMAIGPKVDRIDAQNALRLANSLDAIDQVEEEIWAGGNRMAPSTRAALSTEADRRRSDIRKEEIERQVEVGEDLTVAFIDPGQSLTLTQVADALARDDISREVAWTLMNGLSSGEGSPKASNPFTLSRWRGEISKLPWTGANSRVKEKARYIRRAIQMASMGLNPNGTPTGQSPTISGEDVFKLMKDVDLKVKTALETPEYQDAWEMVRTHTGVTTDILGQLYGNQGQRDAAILFKIALDNYMDLYGVDAKPVDFVSSNKASFKPEEFTRGVDRKFYDEFPQVRTFMTDAKGEITDFDEQRQAAFIIWWRNAVTGGTIDPEFAAEISAKFAAYYRGQGIAPGDGELALEPENPLYHQFER